MKLISKLLGNTALSRKQAQVALKLDEIAIIKSRQSADEASIQAEIDRIDNLIDKLRRERKRVVKKQASVTLINLTRLEQLEKELEALMENQSAITKESLTNDEEKTEDIHS